MKIFSARQIRACDAQTLDEQHINVVTLMERAATACYHWLLQQYNRHQEFLIICGMGNNGGDGLALCRLMRANGFNARALIVKHKATFAPATSENFKKLHDFARDSVQLIEPGEAIAELPTHIVLIDALLGAGLNRPVEGALAATIASLNRLPNQKIAIDLPSGLSTDRLPDDTDAVLSADNTLTFQFPKRVFLHREGAIHTGMTTVLDIGLSQEFIAKEPPVAQTIDLSVIQSIYRLRDPFSHKGDYGTAMLTGGSYGSIGAILLAARAALHAGAGKVFVAAPECGLDIIQTSVPEAQFKTAGSTYVSHIPKAQPGTTLAIGPGLGCHPETVRAFASFLSTVTQPLILDADALNIIAWHPETLLPKIPPGSVLTPHPKEFERLFGHFGNTLEQAEQAHYQAMKLNCHIALKGHHTFLAFADGRCWYNTTGNAGMATGGSGDVLTGIICGLKAQNYPMDEAMLLGIYLHGLAGDLAATAHSKEALTAGSLINYLGNAFLDIRSGVAHNR